MALLNFRLYSFIGSFCGCCVAAKESCDAILFIFDDRFFCLFSFRWVRCALKSDVLCERPFVYLSDIHSKMYWCHMLCVCVMYQQLMTHSHGRHYNERSTCLSLGQSDSPHNPLSSCCDLRTILLPGDFNDYNFDFTS
jgi:hypothetical protein